MDIVKQVAYDTETTGLRAHKGDRPFLYILSDGKTDEAEYDKEKVRGILGSKQVKKIMHNAKFDILMTQAAGMSFKGKFEDTAIAAHLINENISNSLDKSGEYYLKERKLVDEVEKWFKDNGIKKDDRDYTMLPKEIIIPYGKQDGGMTYRLWEKLEPMLEKRGLKRLYAQEKRLVPVLMDIQKRGIKIDVTYFKNLLGVLERSKTPKAKEIHEYVGYKFNIGSPQQLIKACLEHNVPLPRKKVKGVLGNYTTSKKKIEHISHPLLDLVRKYRNIESNKRFTDNLLKQQVNGFIHCDLNATGTVTGRFSSSNPNMQNMPNEDPTIRNGFMPREGFVNFCFDYSQMEYCALMDYAKSEKMLSRIKNGEDLHQATADLLDITRKKAKIINFAIVYGMGDEALGQSLGLSKQGAREILNEYFKEMPEVKEFIDSVKNKIYNKGFIKNKFGRCRRLEARDAYKAVNSLIQGVTADMVKAAMIRVAKVLEGYKSSIILQVHDEIKVEIHKDEFHLIPIIKKEMERWDHMFKVPFKVDVEYYTDNWGNKKDWEGVLV